MSAPDWDLASVQDRLATIASMPTPPVHRLLASELRSMATWLEKAGIEMGEPDPGIWENAA